MEKWYCLQTFAKREFQLSEQLNQMGVQAYAPRYQRESRYPVQSWNPLKKIRETVYVPRIETHAFFPSYLFVSLDYYSTKKIPYIKRLPTRLKSHVVGTVDFDMVREIQSRENVHGFVMQKNVCEFEKGEIVQVVDGGLKGYEVIFDSMLGDLERCVVLTTMFDRQMQVPIEYNLLKRLSFA
jgi:transcription antitermination factor NusG